MDDRRKSIEEFIKSLQSDSLSKNFGITSNSFGKQLLQARDLSEEALAHEVLKKTGIPIPSDSATLLRKEDFYNQILNEVYPEFKGDTDLSISSKIGKGSLGEYDPNKGNITLSENTGKKGVREGLGTALHEAAHKYDDKVLKYNMPKHLLTGENAYAQLDVNKAVNKFSDSTKDLDAVQLYETAAKGHHAKIPDLRDSNSFGIGALKSMLKSGTFKQVAGALPLAGTAMAISSGDASAAAEELPSEIPGVGQVYDAVRSESAGNAQDDYDMINEVNARKAYDSSQARRDMLKKIGQ